MADDSRKIIRVSAESDKAIRDYGERRGIEFGEAADALIGTAVSRLNALKRYTKNREPQAPGKKKAAKKIAAKSAKPKATAKKKAAAKAPPKAATNGAATNGAAAHA